MPYNKMEILRDAQEKWETTLLPSPEFQAVLKAPGGEKRLEELHGIYLTRAVKTERGRRTEEAQALGLERSQFFGGEELGMTQAIVRNLAVGMSSGVFTGLEQLGVIDPAHAQRARDLSEKELYEGMPGLARGTREFLNKGAAVSAKGLSLGNKSFEEALYGVLRYVPDIAAAAVGLPGLVATPGVEEPEVTTFAGKAGRVAGMAIEFFTGLGKVSKFVPGAKGLAAAGTAARLLERSAQALAASLVMESGMPNPDAKRALTNFGTYFTIMGASKLIQPRLQRALLAHSPLGPLTMKMAQGGIMQRAMGKTLATGGAGANYLFVTRADDWIESVFESTWLATQRPEGTSYVTAFVGALPVSLAWNYFAESFGSLTGLMRMDAAATAAKEGRTVTGRDVMRHNEGMRIGVQEALKAELDEFDRLGLEVTPKDQKVIDRAKVILASPTKFRSLGTVGWRESDALTRILVRLESEALMQKEAAEADMPKTVEEEKQQYVVQEVTGEAPVAEVAPELQLQQEQSWVVKGYLHPNDVNTFRRIQRVVVGMNQYFDFGFDVPLTVVPKRKPQFGAGLGPLKGVGDRNKPYIDISVRQKKFKRDLVKGEDIWWRRPFDDAELQLTIAHELAHAWGRGHNAKMRVADAELVKLVKRLWDADVAEGAQVSPPTGIVLATKPVPDPTSEDATIWPVPPQVPTIYHHGREYSESGQLYLEATTLDPVEVTPDPTDVEKPGIDLVTPIPPSPPETPTTPNGIPEYVPAEAHRKPIETPRPGILTRASLAWHRLQNVEKTFKDEGFPLTGIEVKAAAGKIDTEHSRARAVMMKMSNLGLSEHSFRLALYAATDPTYRAKVVKQRSRKSKKIVRAADLGREYFDIMFKVLKKEGALREEWPDSQINRMRVDIADLIESGANTDNPELVDKYLREIMELQEGIRFLKDRNIRFVHISKVWLQHLFEHDQQAAARLSGRYFKRRSTIDMQALAEFLISEKLIEEKDTDLRSVVAAYADKAGKVLAETAIVKAAQKEGAFAKPRTQPFWRGITSTQRAILGAWKTEKVIQPDGRVTRRRIAPDLRVHPFIEEWSNEFHKKGPMVNVGRFLSFVKGMQFTNPFYLTMNDTWQAFWAGALTTPRLPISMFKAAKMLKNKPSEFYEILPYLASKPYTPNFEGWMRTSGEAMFRGGYLGRFAKWVKINARPSELGAALLMKPLWNVAWGGDHFMRLTVYHHLRKARNLSKKDAALRTAKYLGDYANVPPNTRRGLNKFLFTPTFAIVMAQLHWEMLTSAGKWFVNAARMKKSSERVRHMTRGAFMLAAGIVFRDWIMQMLGFTRDQYGMKYTKEVINEKGERRELVINTPSPDNVMLRYLHGFLTLPDGPDKWDRFVDVSTWRLTPVWRITIRYLQDRKNDGSAIYNPFDDKDKVLKDSLKWWITELAPILKVAPGLTPKAKKEAHAALQQDLSKVWSTILGTLFFEYTRSTKDKRLQWQMVDLRDSYKEFMRRDQTDDIAVIEARQRNFEAQMKEYMEELERYERGRK